MKSDGFFDYTAMLQPAVYALLYKGRLQYIGKSKFPANRMGQHRHSKKPIKTVFGGRFDIGFPFDEVWLRPCAESEMEEIEIAMIRKYRPKHNTKHNEPDSIDLVQVLDLLAMKPKSISIDRRL
jgi:hypothetical protein